MFVIVGLGNPGPSYDGTRHNVGFALLDALARQGSAVLRGHGSYDGGRGLLWGKPVFFLKPLTFMNRSGEALRSVRSAHAGLSEAPVVVLHDELDIPFGAVRVKLGGGSGGHNGLKSLIEVTGQDFLRIRLGIGRPPPEWGEDAVSRWVLARFSGEEQARFGEVLRTGSRAVELLMTEGLRAAQNEIHRLDVPEVSGEGVG